MIALEVIWESLFQQSCSLRLARPSPSLPCKYFDPSWGFSSSSSAAVLEPNWTLVQQLICRSFRATRQSRILSSKTSRKSKTRMRGLTKLFWPRLSSACHPRPRPPRYRPVRSMMRKRRPRTLRVRLIKPLRMPRARPKRHSQTQRRRVRNRKIKLLPRQNKYRLPRKTRPRRQWVATLPQRYQVLWRWTQLQSSSRDNGWRMRKAKTWYFLIQLTRHTMLCSLTSRQMRSQSSIRMTTEEVWTPNSRILMAKNEPFKS